MPSLHCLREINQSRMFILKYIKGDKVIWAVVVLLSLLSILVVYSSVVALAYRYKNGDTASYLIKHVKNNKAAVEKLAGKIKAQIIPTGTTIGTNACLKSFITSCFIDSILATYVIKASLAKSEVWNVSEVPGIASHLAASPALTPLIKV